MKNAFFATTLLAVCALLLLLVGPAAAARGSLRTSSASGDALCACLTCTPEKCDPCHCPYIADPSSFEYDVLKIKDSVSGDKSKGPGPTDYPSPDPEPIEDPIDKPKTSWRYFGSRY